MRKRVAVAVLSVALVLVGSGIVLALDAARDARARFRSMHLPARFSHVEEHIFPVANSPTFALTSQRGGVTISRGDDTDVVVRATIHAPPDVTLASLGDTITRDGDTITVEEHPEHTVTLFGPIPTIDYDVRVPAHTTIAPVRNHDGAIVVSDIVGTITLSGTNGPITVRGFDGAVTVTSSNGRIFLGDGRGTLDLTTQNAAIEVQNVQVTAMTVQSTNGGVRFSGSLAPGGNGRIDTTNGAIAVSLLVLAGSGVTLDALTTNGGVHVAFPVTPAPGANGRDRKTVQGTIGTPDSVLTIRSQNGSIVIGKQG